MITKVTVTFTRETVVDDDDGDTSYLCDATRLAAYRRGDWSFIGIRAKATIRIDYDQGHGRYSSFHELTSPGLYGIESDSDESYLAQRYQEECDALKSDIQAMAHAEFKE